MKKFLSKLVLFITGTAMAVGVGVAAIHSVYKEAFASYSGAAPYTITLDDNSLEAGTSYIHTETDTTISGIELTWNHLNPSNGQMKANGSGDENFYIFNNDALPGKITSIVVTFTNGSSYTPRAKVGTSAFDSAPFTTGGSEKTSNDGSVYTWDFDVDNAKYFCFYIETGLGAIKASTISITYEQTPTSIEINASSTQQTTFYVGDTFSAAGLVVDVNYENGGSETLTAGDDYTVSTPDLSSTGNKTVTITPQVGGKAEGCAAISYDITVNPARELESVTLTGDLTDKDYTVGESWDLTGISVTGNYSDSSHENLGTLNSLVTADKISFTLDPVKPVLDGTTLDIIDIVYNDTINATADFQITGISVIDKVRYVLCDDETLTVGNYMLVTSDDYAVSNILTGNEKRIVAENDFEIEGECIFEPASKFIYTVAKDGDYYTFYNTTSKYLAGTTANESGFSETVTDYAKWTVTYEDGGYKLVNKVVSGYLQKNSSNAFFGCYSSGALGALYLYKELPPVVEADVVDGRTTIGVSATATITTSLKNGASGSPTFTSGNDSVLTVVANGDGTATVTGVAEGATTVTIHLPGCEDVVLNFTIKEVALDRITVETQPTKINYVVGEDFNAAGLTIKAFYSNNTEEVKSTGFNLSAVDLTTKGTKVVTVSYTEDDVTRTTTFEVVVAYPSLTVGEAIDIIKPLEKNEPTAITYRVSGKVVDKEWNSGDGGYGNINIAEKYNEQDSSKLFQIYRAFAGDKATFNTLLVGANIVIESKLQKYVKGGVDIYETTANPEIISFDTEVEKLVIGVSIYREPEKTQYYVGDSTFDYAGLKVKLHYNDSSSETVVYSDNVETFLSTFSFANPDTSDSKAYVPVTVTHKETGFTATFNVSVSDIKVNSISVTTSPTKTTYASGEEFDPTGIVVTAKNNNGTTFIVEDSEKLTYRTPSGNGRVYEGDTHVTVVYDNNNNITKSIPITVLEKYVVNITASMPEGYHDDTYDVGDSFSSRSLVIKVNYSDGTEDKYNSKTGFDLFIITPPDMTTAGEKDVIITLKGTEFSTKLRIHIKGIEELIIDTIPYLTVYSVGDDLNFNGLELYALYTDGDVKEIKINYEGLSISGDTSKDGPQQDITFTYAGKSASYKIDVWLTQELLNSLVETELAKLRSSLHESDYSSVNWMNVQRIVSELEFVLYSFNASKEGEHYTSDVMGYVDIAKEEIAKIETRSVSHIEVTPPTKTIYEVGEKLDKTGMEVTLYYDNGDHRSVNVDECEITGFDSSSTGYKIVTVSYMGKIDSFEVIITKAYEDDELAEKINIAIAEYIDYFDSIDLSGYSEEVVAQFMAAKEAAIEAISNATTEEEIAAALENARSVLNKLVTDNPKTPAAPNTNRILIISLIIGGALLLGAGVVVVSVLIIKKKNRIEK